VRLLILLLLPLLFILSGRPVECHGIALIIATVKLTGKKNREAITRNRPHGPHETKASRRSKRLINARSLLYKYFEIKFSSS